MKKTSQSKKKSKAAISNRNDKKKPGVWSIVMTAIGAGLGVVVGQVLGIAGLLGFLVAFAIGYFPGMWLGKWWGKKASAERSVKYLIYINIIAWLIPLIGYFVGGLTLTMVHEKKIPGKLYPILGYGGLLLSVINGIWGAYSMMQMLG